MRYLCIIFFVFLVSCCKEKKASYNQRRMVFLQSYSTLDYELDSKMNQLKLTETFMLLDEIRKESISQEKYYFDLFKFRLFLLKGNKEESLRYLESIKLINPMMWHFYKGVLHEFLEPDLTLSISEYKKSLELCKDDFFRIYLFFLINNDVDLFLENLKGYDIKAFNFFKKEFELKSNLFRESILLNEVLNNSLFLPEN
ncbi:hypothetical protein TPENAI_60741 [Tenacibaculum litopenaei]